MCSCKTTTRSGTIILAGNATSGRSDVECPECQNATRRKTKAGRNHYEAHGPCQTDGQRAYRRRVK